MNEFVPRIDSLSAERNTPPVRPAPAVAPVQPSAASSQGANTSGAGTDAGEHARREHMASASDYARVQARIADILADMHASTAEPAAALDEAQNRIGSLSLSSTVIIPLPPASVESIERAVQVAQAMAEQASLARSSQANVSTGTVDQILSITA